MHRIVLQISRANVRSCSWAARDRSLTHHFDRVYSVLTLALKLLLVHGAILPARAECRTARSTFGSNVEPPFYIRVECRTTRSTFPPNVEPPVLHSP